MAELNRFLVFTRRLNALGARYMVSGSVAVIIYGAPRFTFYVPPIEAIKAEAARAERGHFNIIDHETGFKADFYLVGRDPLHAWALERTQRYEVAGEPFIVAPPEYVIVRKLEFYREGGSEKHLRDIRSMLDTSPDALDRAELDRLIGERGLQDAWKKVRTIGE